jgi:hypothetical protein
MSPYFYDKRRRANCAVSKFSRGKLETTDINKAGNAVRLAGYWDTLGYINLDQFRNWRSDAQERQQSREEQAV